MDNDHKAVELAQAIKGLTTNWAHQLEILALEARFAKARFDALRKAGFDAGQAPLLCTRRVEL